MAIDPDSKSGPDVGHNNSFIKITNHPDLPALSVLRTQYRETLQLDGQKGTRTQPPPITSIDIFPRQAQLTYLTNPESIKVALTANEVIQSSTIEALLNALTGINTNILGEVDLTNTKLDGLTSQGDTTNNILSGGLSAPLDAVKLLDEVVVNTTSPAQNILGYNFTTVQVSLTGNGSMLIQTSNNGANWYDEVTKTEDDMVVLIGSAKFVRTVYTQGGGGRGTAIVTATR